MHSLTCLPMVLGKSQLDVYLWAIVGPHCLQNLIDCLKPLFVHWQIRYLKLPESGAGKKKLKEKVARNFQIPSSNCVGIL